MSFASAVLKLCYPRTRPSVTLSPSTPCSILHSPTTEPGRRGWALAKGSPVPTPHFFASSNSWNQSTPAEWKLPSRVTEGRGIFPSRPSRSHPSRLNCLCDLTRTEEKLHSGFFPTTSDVLERAFNTIRPQEIEQHAE